MNNSTRYNNRRSYGYGSYNYGSTARAYTYSSRTPKRKQETEQPSTIRVDEYGALHRVALIGIMVLLAALSLAFLCVYGYNYELSTEIAGLQSELNELKEDNYYLESEFDNNLNLDYIEEVAINKLGMQKPSSYQIKYINVPKQSYTVLYTSEEQEEGLWAYIKSFDFKSAIKAILGSD